MATALSVGRLVLIGAALVANSIGLPTPACAQSAPRFVAQPPFNVAIGPDVGRQSMALADLNNDGRPDLVAIEPDESRVDVFLNQGDGTFDLVTTPGLVEDVYPTAVAVADVASPFGSVSEGRPDGRPDIIVGGDAGEVEVIFGRGDGQFDPPEQVIEPDATIGIVGLVAGDFDSGHGLDVALLDEDGVVLLCNDGLGNLSQCSGDDPLETGISPIDIVSGDFNGDGREDVAVLDSDGQRVYPFLGNGDATFIFGEGVNVAGEAHDDVAVDLDVGRLDGDARDDLVIANNDDFNEFLGVALFGMSDGSFRSQPFVLDFGATAVAVGDFNRDGSDDLVSGYDEFSAGIRIHFGDGRGAFSDPIYPQGGSSLGPVALALAGDLDGDGLGDLVVLDADGEQVRVLLNRDGGVPSCTGDCNGNGTVSIDELVRGVDILLGQSALSECLALDVDANSRVTVNELVAAVARDMSGC